MHPKCTTLHFLLPGYSVFVSCRLCTTTVDGWMVGWRGPRAQLVWSGLWSKLMLDKTCMCVVVLVVIVANFVLRIKPRENTGHSLGN